MIKTEVIIVGGGPAGAACASRLRQHQIDCIVLDRAVFPRNKPCAGWITPNVFNLLQVQPEDYPHNLVNFRSFEISIRGIKFRLPTNQFAIRRSEFDHWLLTRTNPRLEQHAVHQIISDGETYVIDDKFQARYLVGAGGTHCPVRRTFFQHSPDLDKKRLILTKEAEFEHPISDNRCHLWFFENGLPGYAWYVPKNDSIINVGIGGKAIGLQTKGKTLNAYWEHHLSNLQQSGILKDCNPEPVGYSYHLRSRAPQTQKDRIFLIGDALGLATQDMGEGIGPAIQSGLLAADAIASGTSYQVSSIPKYSFPAILGLRA